MNLPSSMTQRGNEDGWMKPAVDRVREASADSDRRDLTGKELDQLKQILALGIKSSMKTFIII